MVKLESVGSLLKDREEHVCEENLNPKKLKIYKAIAGDSWFLYCIDKENINFVLPIRGCPYCLQHLE